MSDSQLYMNIAIWSQVVSSIVFLGALVFMWFKWLMPLLMAAQARSNAQIAEAERHRDEANAALQTLRDEIATARHDAGLIAQRGAERADHERAALLQEATEAGERSLADAGRELERARGAARQRLRDELVEKALRVAREDAARRIDSAAQDRLVDRFVGSLEATVRG
jgi:F-type H+-transporting ATPase subunit b